MSLTENQIEDLLFLKNPDMWPRWPVCPVRRNKNIPGQSVASPWGNNENGVVVDGETVVYLLNIFAIKSSSDFETADKCVYASLEEIINDGWYID